MYGVGCSFGVNVWTFRLCGVSSRFFYCCVFSYGICCCFVECMLDGLRQLRTLNPGEVYVRIHNFLSCYELQKSWQRKYHVNPFVIDAKSESSV